MFNIFYFLYFDNYFQVKWESDESMFITIMWKHSIKTIFTTVTTIGANHLPNMTLSIWKSINSSRHYNKLNFHQKKKKCSKLRSLVLYWVIFTWDASFYFNFDDNSVRSFERSKFQMKSSRSSPESFKIPTIFRVSSILANFRSIEFLKFLVVRLW